MLKNSFLRKFKAKKNIGYDYEKYILSEDENYIINLERPLSIKEIKKLPKEKLQIFIDDIMCNNKVNNLLYLGNSKKELYLYLKQKKSLLKNTKLTDPIDLSKVRRKLRPCESLFLKKKKVKMFDVIKNNIKNFKLMKSLSMSKLMGKNKEFYKTQQNSEKISRKLLYKPVNEARYNGYKRSFQTCLEKSKSDPNFSLPDVKFKLDNVYSRLYHNRIFYPMNLKIKDNKKKKKKNINLKSMNSTNISSNLRNDINSLNSFKTNDETKKKIPKFSLRNIFREYGGKEFLITPTYSNRYKCWKKISGGPKIKENLFPENDKQDVDIIDINGCKDNNLNNKLHIAVKENKEEFVKYFLDKNFDPNEQNIFGETSMHYAMELKNKNIIKLLIEKGGNIYIKNNKGITPYDLADKDIKMHFNLKEV